MSNTVSDSLKPLVVTPGDPAGIGPDLCISIAAGPTDQAFVVIADPAVLADRAKLLGVEIHINELDAANLDGAKHTAGVLNVIPLSLQGQVNAGTASAASGSHVLQALGLAVELCSQRSCSALVTGPVNKAVVALTEPDFAGHTEWLAARTGAALPVMMLAAGNLRVALVTTHIPLRDVPLAITTDAITRTGRIVWRELQQKFGIANPRICVAGLNPHAGEDGLLGSEEQTIIAPSLAILASEGIPMIGPLPADTMFTPKYLDQTDAFIAMYHDQGLTVVKHAGFGEVVNVTLGLPIIRTSVDHGTAYDLAGTGKASDSSLRTAMRWAASLAAGRPPA